MISLFLLVKKNQKPPTVHSIAWEQMLPALEIDPETNSWKSLYKVKQILGSFFHREITSNSSTFKGKQSLRPNNQNTENTYFQCCPKPNPLHSAYQQAQVPPQSPRALHSSLHLLEINQSETMGCYRLLDNSMQTEWKKCITAKLCSLDTVAESWFSFFFI